MRMRLTHLIVAILIAMLCVAVGFDRSKAANLDEACGGAANITCNSALWCQRAGGQCNVADVAGKCDKAPAFCMQIYRPVCGCNGKTYANDCERQKARVQLDYVGACPKEPKAKEPKAVTPKSKAKSEKK